MPFVHLLALLLLAFVSDQRLRRAEASKAPVKAPYITFRGPLLNHSYIDFDQVGAEEESSVQCHTDLPTCCTGSQGPDRGDWYSPDGTKLNFLAPGPGVYEVRRPQRVELRRRQGRVVSGLYRCEVGTRTSTRRDGGRRRVYVGLYADGGGDVKITSGMTFTANSAGASPRFTLTCISTGGPATTVAWTRDSVPLNPRQHNMTRVLLDPRTARYSHTLTVAGLEGVYTCAVANDKPSRVSAELAVKAPSPPSGVSVSQNGLDSVLVSWTPPSGEPAVTGYIIYYQQDGGQRLSQSAGPTATITGLTMGMPLSINVVAISLTLPSAPSSSITIDLDDSYQGAHTTGSWTLTTLYFIPVLLMCYCMYSGKCHKYVNMHRYK